MNLNLMYTPKRGLMINDANLCPSRELETIAIVVSSMISLFLTQKEIAEQVYKDFLSFLIDSHGKELLTYKKDFKFSDFTVKYIEQRVIKAGKDSNPPT